LCSHDISSILWYLTSIIFIISCNSLFLWWLSNNAYSMHIQLMRWVWALQTAAVLQDCLHLDSGAYLDHQSIYNFTVDFDHGKAAQRSAFQGQLLSSKQNHQSVSKIISLSCVMAPIREHSLVILRRFLLGSSRPLAFHSSRSRSWSQYKNSESNSRSGFGLILRFQVLKFEIEF